MPIVKDNRRKIVRSQLSKPIMQMNDELSCNTYISKYAIRGRVYIV